MSKKAKQDDEIKDPAGNPPPADNADSTATGNEDGTKKADESVSEKSADKTDDLVEGGVIHPVAFEVTLKSIHPQATYGRCGYRFNKTAAVRIPCEALSGEQISALADDPYLEFVPVVEDDA